MARARDKAEVQIHEMSREEAYEMVDSLARERLGMGVDEFIRALDAGEFEDIDTPEIMSIVMLLPFVQDGR